MINPTASAAPLFVYGEALRLRNEAGVPRRLFEGDDRPRGVLDQPGDRLAQKRLGGTAGQHGDAGKLRREIGGNLHARSNLSGISGGSHTTLWSGRRQTALPGRVMGSLRV